MSEVKLLWALWWLMPYNGVVPHPVAHFESVEECDAVRKVLAENSNPAFFRCIRAKYAKP